MPKNEIDYSNTIIYKITCKNSEVKDVYVGHTTNFVQRKHAHKQACINIKSGNYNSKVYSVIRANGGWENWQMEIINFFDCADHYAARKKEQEYFIELNATLNSIDPLPKPKAITTNVMIKQPKKNKLFNPSNMKNDNSKSLDKDCIIPQTVLKNNANFKCEQCDFLCSKASDYNRHLITLKHLKANNANAVNQSATNSLMCGKCNHEFKHASSLSRHKKNVKLQKRTK